MADKIKKLVEGLREDAYWASCNEWETPITLGDHLNDAADLIESFAAELEQVKRERDAAVEELSYSRKCSICKKHLSEGGNCYGNHKCGNGNPDWQWRGAKEDRHGA